MKNKSRGLFDEQFRLDKIGKQNDPLIKLQVHIDFEIFRKPSGCHNRVNEHYLQFIQVNADKSEPEHQVGRPNGPNIILPRMKSKSQRNS